MKKTINGVSAAVFDLDGTLFDSLGLWNDIDEIFLAKRGLKPTEEYRHGIVALGYRGTACFTVEYYGLDDTPEQLMEEWNELAEHAYANDIRLMPGAREYLLQCKAAGIKIAAVSALRRELAEPCLRNNGVYDLFDGIFTVDETGFDKTQPEIYLHTARVLGVEPKHCVAFDDAAVALTAANNAGMHTVAIVGKLLSADAAESIADRVIKTWPEAPTLL